MKYLLILTAVIEAGAGLALMCCPSATAVLMLGASLETFAAITLGRVAGMALFTLGMANWLAHYDANSAAARGLVKAMTFYNLGAAGILAAAGIWSQLVGAALWPAVIVHAGMFVWCLISLLKKSVLDLKD